ncbi:MAG TPA: VOC family protein [Solirubrobacteraceae bacterium]|nr:VOC family protein [Solirubrobacteraceae bacterium]
MRLEGIHHVTAITAQAQPTVDFYAGTLGLRFVKQTVNYDQPDAYHLYFGDQAGAPGSIMTFFEYPGVERGRHGAGMIHTLTWRVPSLGALDFWEQRLARAGVQGERGQSNLRVADPEGIGIEFAVVEVDDPPLRASAAGIPAEHALQGFHGARAYTADPERSRPLLDALNFEDGTHVNGEERHAVYEYDAAPGERGIQGAGTVHHIAWASRDEDHERWRETIAAAGAQPTAVIDRTYFRSIYFREPSGVLFEIATLSPGFTVDEPPDRLGRALVLPPHLEHRRGQLERLLTPIDIH